MGRTRAELEAQRSGWERAFGALVRKWTKDSPIRAAMGSLAWGRYDGESRPDETKDDIAVGLGYLWGTRDTLLAMARVLGRPEARDLERFHDLLRVLK